MRKAINSINSLSKLFLEAASADSTKSVTSIKENEHNILLQTISKFGWLAKKTKLNDLFFNELTHIVEEFTAFELTALDDGDMEVDITDKHSKNLEIEHSKRKILRKIDIIICLMERIKLSKGH